MSGKVDKLISRQAAIDAIIGQPPEPHYPTWYAEQIKALPSAEPERKKGMWIDSSDVCWLCSECGKWLDVLQGDADMNFCPNCGSRNIEEGEQE